MYEDTSVSTFSQNKYRDFGRKTLWYLIAQKTNASAAFVFLIAIGIVVRGQFNMSPEVLAALDVLIWLSVGLAVLSLFVGLVVAFLIHKNRGFMLCEDAIKIKRGVFLKEEFSIPYRQVQNVEIERTIFQQILGTSTFIILTAGHENDHSRKDDPESVIPSIDKEVAIELRDQLLKKANVQKVINHPSL